VLQKKATEQLDMHEGNWNRRPQ